MAITSSLPSPTEMYSALLRKDSAYEGVFWVGVRTTSIFCRPSCPAKKPKVENVEYFPRVKDALAAGYRPCRRCTPLDPAGQAPSWVAPLCLEMDTTTTGRITDTCLRARGLDPARVRRWFQKTHGLTFQAYQRSRRLAGAVRQLDAGSNVTRTAFDTGYESLSGFRDAFAQLFGASPSVVNGDAVLVARRIGTPLGPMIGIANSEGLCLLEFADRPMLETQVKRVRRLLAATVTPGDNPHLDRIELELEEYFAGRLKHFQTPAVTPGSGFQRQVWKSLRAIPYGSTLSYDALARQLSSPGAQRAVGRANGDNRLAIIIPCHRVIRADGTLSGYGGGLWRKRRLLELEAGEIK